MTFRRILLTLVLPGSMYAYHKLPGGPQKKPNHNFKLRNSCMWRHRKAIHISKTQFSTSPELTVVFWVSLQSNILCISAVKPY